jgi:predicted transcriptional regulator
VVIFSIVLALLTPVCSSLWSKIPLSFLEITTGLQLLQGLRMPEKWFICLVAALSAFGGICSAFQVKGVLDYPGANIKKYLLDKMLLSAGTFFLMWGYLKFLLH